MQSLPQAPAVTPELQPGPNANGAMLKFLSLLGSERLSLQDMIYLAEGFLGFFVS